MHRDTLASQKMYKMM